MAQPENHSNNGSERWRSLSTGSCRASVRWPIPWRPWPAGRVFQLLHCAGRDQLAQTDTRALLQAQHGTANPLASFERRASQDIMTVDTSFDQVHVRGVLAWSPAETPHASHAAASAQLLTLASSPPCWRRWRTCSAWGPPPACRMDPPASARCGRGGERCQRAMQGGGLAASPLPCLTILRAMRPGTRHCPNPRAGREARRHALRGGPDRQ